MRDWTDFEQRKLWPPFTWADFPPGYENHGGCHEPFRREDWERRAQTAVDVVSTDHDLDGGMHRTHVHPWCPSCVLDELDHEDAMSGRPTYGDEDWFVGLRLDHARDNALSRVRYWMVNHKGELPIEQPVDEFGLDAEFLDRHDLDDLPTPDPLIEGILPRHGYGILRGRDGTYKSFVALDWSLCLATGKPWQGRTSERVKVLYVAGEGAYGLAARVDAWEHASGHKIDAGAFVVRKSALNLHKPGRAFQHLLEHVATGGYGFVVVDTLRRVSGAADGNGSDMGTVVDNLDKIKRATLDGSVLTIAHTDKSDTDSRGYSGIEDDADFVWHAKRDEDVLTLKNTKMKDGPDGAIFHLAATKTLDSLTLAATTASSTTESQLRILDTLRQSFRDGASAGRLQEATGLPKSSYYRALGELRDAGHVVNTGTKARPFYELRPSIESQTVPIERTRSDLQQSHQSHAVPGFPLGVPRVPPPLGVGPRTQAETEGKREAS